MAQYKTNKVQRSQELLPSTRNSQAAQFADNRSSTAFQLNQQAVMNASPVVQGKVIQRDAYWPTPLNSTIPVAANPGGNYMQRVGGNTNHKLYANAGAAKNAAKEVLNLGFEDTRYSFTAKDAGGGAGGGSYTYYPNTQNNSTKVLVNHDVDPNSALQDQAGNVTSPANHFHAGIIAGQAVTRATQNPTTLVYTQHPSAVDHYFSQ